MDKIAVVVKKNYFAIIVGSVVYYFCLNVFIQLNKYYEEKCNNGEK